MAPAGSLLDDHVFFELAIYHLPRPAVDPATVVRRLARQAGIELVAALPKTLGPAPMVALRSPSIEGYPPPQPEMLEWVADGLTAAQRKQLGATAGVTVLDFTGPPAQARAVYRRALDLMAKLQAATGGLLWDDETGEIFTAASWLDRLQGWNEEVPSVVSHVAVRWYNHGELIRMITKGMAKFALPDLVVSEVDPSSTAAMGKVLDLVAQAMLERPLLEKAGTLPVSVDGSTHAEFRAWAGQHLYPNARRKGVVQLAIGQHVENERDTRLLEVIFPGPAGELHVRHDRLLDELFGSTDRSARVDHADPRLVLISRRAVKALMGYKRGFAERRGKGETLLVKGAFATASGGREFMWLQVLRWQDKTISGLLQNDPLEVPGLKSGARVELDEDAVFDYLLRRPDGTEEGNETGKFIERLQ
jgi:hypothetical protein